VAGPEIAIAIVGDASKFRRELDRAGKSTESFGSRLKGMSKMAALAVGGAALGGLVVGLKSSIGAAKEAEQAQARLEQALASAGISYRKQGEAIDEAIQKTSKLAALDDEELSDSFAKLVRTSGDVQKSIEGMGLAADIARARNISLEAATKMVEKALAGQDTAFTRIGIRMKQNQDATDALAEAQRRFGGAAEKHGATAAAAQERLSVAFENLQERIGAKLLPVFTQLINKLTEVVTWVEVNWPRIEAEFNRSMEKAKAIFEKIKPILKIIIDQIVAIVKLVKAIIDGDWSQVWDSVVAIVRNAMRMLVEVIKLWMGTIGKAALELGKSIVAAIGEGLKALPGVMLNALKAIPGLILSLQKAFFSAAFALGKAVVSGIAEGLAGAASAVGGAIGEAVRAAINALIDRVNSALEITIPIPFAADKHIDPIDIPHLARGTQNFAGGMALVGEQGPELVGLPRGSSVTPNHRLGGGGLTIHVHGSVIAERELFALVQKHSLQYEMQNGTNGLSRRS
jgi:hypothetical protein